MVVNYYACTKKITSKGVYCDNKNVKGPDIEKVVIGSILDIDTDMLLVNLSSNDLGVSSKESDIKYIQSKIKSKKLQLNSLFDKMADFDDDLSDLFKDRINELVKEIKELSAKYNNLVNEVDSSKSEFKNVELVVNVVNEFKTYYDCVDDLKKRRFMLGVIIDKIRWNGDTEKVDIEFWGSKKIDNSLPFITKLSQYIESRMTNSVSIAIYDKLKLDLFPPYIPLYKSIVLTCTEYLTEEYLYTDTIGEFIVKFKNNNNLTLKDISNMTGFSISHISNVINGKHPSVDLIKSINKLKHL